MARSSLFWAASVAISLRRSAYHSGERGFGRGQSGVACRVGSSALGGPVKPLKGEVWRSLGPVENLPVAISDRPAGTQVAYRPINLTSVSLRVLAYQPPPTRRPMHTIAVSFRLSLRRRGANSGA